MQSDIVFGSSISAVYDQYLVPLIFEHYAADMAKRVQAIVAASRASANSAQTRDNDDRQSATRVLELAAGTGVVTRAMASAMPTDVEIIATDLNPAMLEQAQRRGVSGAVRWQKADAMQLPFDDASVDVVVCQFGVMFFPDKVKAFAESRRVLRAGGVLVFNVWDRIEENAWAAAVTEAMARMYPDNPATFMALVPHGYSDSAQIMQDVRGGGFDDDVAIDVVTARSRAESARDVAVALCQGTPLRNEIEVRGGRSLAEATAVAEQFIRERFGNGVIEGQMQAKVVTVG